MRAKLPLALPLLAALLVGVPTEAPAHEPSTEPPSTRGAEELAREAVRNLLEAFEMLLESVPQYEAPEINEDGDIIIRRRYPEGDRTPRPDDDGESPDEART